MRIICLSLMLLAGLLHGCQKDESQQGGGGFSPPPMPVEIAPAVQTTVQDVFEALGSVDAIEQVVIVSEIDGIVVRLPFREGAAVARGHLLALLDDAEPAAQVSRAEAVRDQKKVSYERVRTVVEKGAGAPQDLDDAAAALKVAEAELALARARLKKTRVVAPFAGMVGTRRVSPGAFVRTGQEITELTQLGEVEVAFSAPERYMPQLKTGAPVMVGTNAYPEETFEGVIHVIDPVLDPETRSVEVIARVKNPERHLRPGMSADVSAVLGQRPNSLTIPNEAIFAEGNQSFVYVVNPDSTVRRAVVVTGTRFRDAVEVISGLDPGARVVRAGHQKLFPGARIMPVDSRGGEPEDSPTTPESAQAGEESR